MTPGPSRVLPEGRGALSPRRGIGNAGHRLPLAKRKPMRWFMGVVLATGVLSASALADETLAVKLVEKLGGSVTRDDKQPGKPVIGVTVSSPKLTDAELRILTDLKQLTSLSLGQTKVTDAGL